MSFSPSKPVKHVMELRTFDTKYQHYFSDGTGRDQFVMYNNGGFSVPRMYNPMKGTAYMRMGNSAATSGSPSPRKEAMPVEYRSDGTGRDGYIVCNSGGLKQMFNRTHGEQFFKDSLRVSERKMFKSQQNRGGRAQINKYLQKPFEVDITQYRNWITPKQQLQISMLAKQQKALVNKLSPLRTSGQQFDTNPSTP